MPEPLPPELAAILAETAARRGRLGHTVEYFSEISSTNDHASALAEAGAGEGAVVIAAAQTAGRGRLGRQWYSPPGAGLYFSIVFREQRVAPYLTLAAGVAVARGIQTATGLPVEIKWPNDVVTAGSNGPGRRRKLAGVLAEGSSSPDGLQHVVLGIGINLSPAAYPRELADRASSIEAELGRPVDASRIFGEVLAALAGEVADLERRGPAGCLQRWRALAPSASGAAVEYDRPGGRVHGTAAGIADDGALLVRVGNTIDRVVAGEVLWK
ncbi:MAG TPA: biotin--[acetyl-CoA-carboxylase] ligase [Vicinamibacterales bacterium]|nr:biotin--[acetyl-CoA-carboxylase] ligase [Vicinamibacterales bacterium]